MQRVGHFHLPHRRRQGRRTLGGLECDDSDGATWRECPIESGRKSKRTQIARCEVGEGSGRKPWPPLDFELLGCQKSTETIAPASSHYYFGTTPNCCNRPSVSIRMRLSAILPLARRSITTPVTVTFLSVDGMPMNVARC